MARRAIESFSSVAASRSPELLTLAHLCTGDEAVAREVVAEQLAALERRWRRTDPFAADAALRHGVITACLHRARGGSLPHRVLRRLVPIAAESSAAPLPPAAAVSADGSAAPAAAAPVVVAPVVVRAPAGLVAEALRAMTPLQRTSLVLVHLENLDPAELADQAGLAPSRVRRELERAHAVVRSHVQPTLGAPAPDVDAEIRRALLDPSWRLGPSEALDAEIARAGLARRRHRRRTRLVALAVVVVLGIAVAVPSVLSVRRDAQVAAQLEVAPPGTGLLSWAPRGAMRRDVGLVAEATAAWRAADPTAPVRTYLLWAGRLGEGRLVIVQGKDSRGQSRVAQIADRGQPGRLGLDSQATLRSSGIPALVVAYAGNLDPALGLSPGPGSSLLQLLLAPTWSARGDRSALEVRLRSPYTEPTKPAEVWRELSVRADGLTRTWLQPARPGSTWETLVRLNDPSATDDEGGRRLATVAVRAGSILPVAASVEQVGDPQPSELADPEIVDDVIAARDVLDALPVNPGADLTSAQAWIAPMTVRALASGSEDLATSLISARVSLLDVIPRGGGHVVLFVVRRGEQLLCIRATPTATDPTLAPVLADTCLVPSAEGPVLVGFARSISPGATILVQSPPVAGVRAVNGYTGSGTLIAIRYPADPTAAVTLGWTAYSPTGQTLGSTTTTVLRARTLPSVPAQPARLSAGTRPGPARGERLAAWAARQPGQQQWTP